MCDSGDFVNLNSHIFVTMPKYRIFFLYYIVRYLILNDAVRLFLFEASVYIPYPSNDMLALTSGQIHLYDSLEPINLYVQTCVFLPLVSEASLEGKTGSGPRLCKGS